MLNCCDVAKAEAINTVCGDTIGNEEPVVLAMFDNRRVETDLTKTPVQGREFGAIDPYALTGAQTG